MLTPDDIDSREFSKAIMGGYRVDEVDEFIAQIKIDYEKLFKQNAELTKKLAVVVEKIEEYRSDEKLLSDTLLRAQKTADEIVSKARREAAEILDEANRKASTAKTDIQNEIIEEQALLDELKNEVSRFRSALLSHYKTHIQLIMDLPSKKPQEQTEEDPKAENGGEQAQKEPSAPQDESETYNVDNNAFAEDAPKAEPGGNEKLKSSDSVKKELGDETDIGNTQSFEAVKDSNNAFADNGNITDPLEPDELRIPVFDDLKFGSDYDVFNDEEDKDGEAGLMSHLFKRKKSK